MDIATCTSTLACLPGRTRQRARLSRFDLLDPAPHPLRASLAQSAHKSVSCAHTPHAFTRTRAPHRQARTHLTHSSTNKHTHKHTCLISTSTRAPHTKARPPPHRQFIRDLKKAGLRYCPALAIAASRRPDPGRAPSRSPLGRSLRRERRPGSRRSVPPCAPPLLPRPPREFSHCRAEGSAMVTT